MRYNSHVSICRSVCRFTDEILIVLECVSGLRDTAHEFYRDSGAKAISVAYSISVALCDCCLSLSRFLENTSELFLQTIQ